MAALDVRRDSPKRTATSPTSAATGTKASCRGSSALTRSRRRRIRCCAARCSAIAASTSSARKCTSRRSCARTRRTASSCCREGTPVESRCATASDRAGRRAHRHAQRVEQRGVDVTLPPEGSLGNYTIRADARERQAQRRRVAGASIAPDDDDGSRASTMTCRTRRSVNGSFLVAAYRRPDFRVDVTLNGESALAGTTLKGVVTGTLSVRRGDERRPVAWTLTRSAVDVRRRPRSTRSLPTSAGRSSAGPTATIERRRARSGGDDATLTKTGDLALDADATERTPACRSSTRSKATSRMCRVSRSPDAPRPRPSGALVHRLAAALVLSSIRRRASKPKSSPWPDGQSRRRGRRGEADAGPVAQRAPGRRQRLLRLGHRAKRRSPSGSWTVTTAARAGAAGRSRCRPAASSS